MASSITHRALQPFYKTLVASIKEDGSSYEVHGETIKVVAKTTDHDELSPELPKRLLSDGYSDMRIRVFQGNSPNYTDHTFPLFAEQSKTQDLGIGHAYKAHGGLAGLSGDPVVIIQEEIKNYKTELKLESAEKERDLYRKKYKTLKAKFNELKGQVGKLPMHELLGTSIASTVKGMLQTPEFRNTALGGLLEDQPQRGGGEIHEFTQVADPLEGLSEEAKQAMFSFDHTFHGDEREQVMSILGYLATEKNQIEQVYNYLTSPKS